ncbi:alpha,alpha-trehalase ath1 [Cladophialophora chaetospira]|uniref:alpha,alpha-trehalase n=1 Tax=Cladophialophora chaetospira TaxID=386627 RepID=A0AA39CID9_9EURO|nr:alpha,alpha-trehalase ath1 [Cladophialophora chaetospira]
MAANNHFLGLILTLFLFSFTSAQSGNASTIYETRFDNVTWDAANWVLTTTNLDPGHYQSRISIANGYHGINLASLGPFFEVEVPENGDNINGWPLLTRRQSFATVGGFWNSMPRTNGTNFPWLYQYGWDTAISGIPHWGGIIADLGGNNFLAASTNPSTISNFESSLDLKQGLKNWAFTWTPAGGHGSFNVSYQLFAHKLDINQGFVQLNITAARTTNITIANVLNGDCAVRSTAGPNGVDAGIIYSAVQPQGVHNVTAYVYAGLTNTGATVHSVQQGTLERPYVGNNQSSIASALHVTLQAGQVATFTKFVGIASTDGFLGPQAVARDAALAARSAGYAASLQTHVAEWARLFPTTSVDDFSFPENGTLPKDAYIIDSAITAVTNAYYLLQNTLSENAINNTANAGTSINSNSISVGGLGSDAYAGQIFWDAEIWMQPGLVAAFPSAAKGIANYRVQRYQQAKRNIGTAFTSSKNDTDFTEAAAIFPWTSGRYGNCTGTGPCWDYQYHLNGDIGLEFTNYWIASGDTETFQNDLWPIYDSVASLYSQIVVKDGDNWLLHNMTDPDEYANHVSNGGYTMAMIATHLTRANQFRSQFNSTPNSTWDNIAQNVLIGKDEDSGVTLEFTGMNGTGVVKQADIILNTFPLSYTEQNYTSSDSLSDLDYYAAKQSVDGPAMTYAIFSVIANGYSPSGCSAYTYDHVGTQPYVRGPWYQFSEQLVDNYQENGGTHPAFPFLTGHGGALQVVLFGYLGFRLVPDFSLHIDPNLPPQIPQIRYRTFHWYGIPIQAFSNQTHTVLTRNSTFTPAEGAFPNATFANSAIPVVVGPVGSPPLATYQLAPDSSVTITNRRIGLIPTTPDNVAQCLPVSSPDEYLPGQFPLAAVDGATSTKWQPSYANKTASVTVTLPQGYRVRSFEFNWGQAPPYNYSVLFHNDSLSNPSAASLPSGPGVQVIANNQRANITDVYNVTALNNIETVQTNVTTFTIPQSAGEVFTSRYATLRIWGSLANSSVSVRNMSGDGATVAEWSIIVDGLPPPPNSTTPGKRDVPLGGNLKARNVDMDLLMKLGHVARAQEKRGRY